ncbi:DJ-1 family glyoxalase III [Spiroplasma culicicola]|uniref:DJ-1 family protein n=1 Tax=Spiroplasma culicicola AES-1 TaxID=1276246 RepID=W6A7C2_9MOLU|nr:DJ-1 family glyoxalase III [Spiroplasma culicicola]AHI52735.1 DJ-1 family protein [Spiroplasma culicicola AES-1]
MAKVAIFLATGFEETEMISTVDVLRRAESLFKGSFEQVDMVSITDKTEVTGSHNITIKADKTMQTINFDEYDCLVLPGGQPGVDNLMQCEVLMNAIEKHAQANKTLAAICAAPQILGKLGLLDKVEVTFYPGCDSYLDNAVKKPQMSAIADGNIITGSSIGGALQFALQIVDHFTSTEQMLALHETLVFNY